MIAERLRMKISTMKFGNIDKITISLGVVEVSPDDNLNKAMKRVDELMYHSKQTGRNKVSY